MSNGTLDRCVYLVELDALLDTRAAILYKTLGEDATINILQKGYFDRTVDDYPDLPFEKFRELYRNRDKSILENALATKVVDMIREYVYSVIKNIISSPFHYEPVVMINIHPYNLTDSECAMIHKMVCAKIGNHAAVEIINLPYEKIGPKFLQKNDIAYFAVYDYVEYLNKHVNTKEYVEYKSPDIGLVIPQIIFSRPKQGANPHINNTFQILEDVIGPYFALNYVPVSDYCINIPKPKSAS